MRAWSSCFALLLALVIFSTSRAVLADDKSGLSPSRLSLPKGPGSLGGIGENVEPNLSMGLMSYTVKIAVPPGYAGLTPQLDLRYSSGAQGAELGLGWTLPVQSIQRMTSRGLPRYTKRDTFVIGDAGELVRTSNEGAAELVYRSRQEGGFVRYTWLESDGADGFWQAEFPDGRVGYYGAEPSGDMVPEARLSGDLGTFRWYLKEVRDSQGHRLVYDYEREGSCAYLTGASWVFVGAVARYHAALNYDTRPDPTSDGKPGFEVACDKRLRGLKVTVAGEQLRRYSLTYEDELGGGVSSGVSRLARVSQYGVGDAGPFPVTFGFGYTSNLEAAAACSGTGMCAKPVVTRIDNPLGVDLKTGTADLLDFNGDSLPDVLDTSGARHRIHQAGVDGAGRRFFEEPIESAATSATLGSARVQLVDLDGNGYSDLADLENLRVLWNRGAGDWEIEQRSDRFLPDMAQDANLRFLDIDGDKRIDVVHADASSTYYYLNAGDGTFSELVGDTLIGASFTTDGLQLTDLNGDGLLDAALLRAGSVSFRMSFGWGHWSEWRELPGIPESWGTSGKLSDIDGDGLSDVVLVEGDTVQVALNRGGRGFEALPPIVSSAALDFPITDPDISVRLVDMNGNGSTDVVWSDSSGQVSFLELFPKRPNLLETVDNGIGKKITVTYGTSAQHMARDGGAGAWRHLLPHPMLTVDRIETRDELNGVTQTQELSYSDGYYDGDEHQFRGFARVRLTTPGDEGSETHVVEDVFDVGDQDRYRAGLLLSEASFSAGRPLSSKEMSYEDCAVYQGQSSSGLPIRFLCQVATTTTVKEGLGSARWVTTVEQSDYDDLGNVTLQSQLGVTAIGGQGCGSCADVAFGACGAQCLGDESFTETRFAHPSSNAGQWLLRTPVSQRTYTSPKYKTFVEERYFYDGEPFVGLESGRATDGLLTRMEQRLGPGDDDFVQVNRVRRDQHGVVVETLDALGHGRRFAYDETSLRLLSESVELERDGEPYELTLSVTYDPLLDTVVSASPWTEGDASPDKLTHYEYDAFGRLTVILRPGDLTAAPTDTFEYELAAPVSRIIRRSRSVAGGDTDLEEVQCFDGLGRKYQERLRVDGDRFRVSGFSIYDALGKEQRNYQSHEARGDACALRAPTHVGALSHRYDGAGRLLSTSSPDADERDGEASVAEVVYEPLLTRAYDEEDATQDGAHTGTPTTTYSDGLGRVVGIEQQLAPGEPKLTRFEYDELGRIGAYVDAQGARRTQSYDLLGRVLSIEDEDFGQLRFEYDAVGNETLRTDAAGRSVQKAYDSANRLIAVWDPASEDATRIEYRYDAIAGCEGSYCDDLEGQLVEVSYPDSRSARGRGGERYGYDVRGRQIYTAKTVGDAVFEFTTGFDNVDRVVRNGYPGGQAVEQVLDGASNVVAIPGILKRVEYEPRGGTRLLEFDNGVVTEYGYDALARLKSLGTTAPDGRSLQAYRYVRDRVGNITSINDESGVPGALPRAQYRYDALYRLRHADLESPSGAVESTDYRYDDAGSLLEKVSSIGRTSPEHAGKFVYAARQHRPKSVGDVELKYDAAGYATSKGSSKLSWDFMGRLLSIESATAAAVHYEYGAGIEPVVAKDGPHTTVYVAPGYELRDGLAQLYVRLGGTRVARMELRDQPPPPTLPDLAPGDAEGKTFTPEPDRRITAADAWIVAATQADVFETEASRDPELVVEMLMASATRLLAAQEAADESVRYLHADHLGSTRVSTNRAGEREQFSDSYPYGAPRLQSQDFREPYTFAGKERSSAQLLMMGARQYDPAFGIFLSPDPAVAKGFEASAPQGLHAYAYANGNPIGAVDPDGHAAQGESTWTKLGGFMSGVGAEIKDQVTFAANASMREGMGMLALGPAYIGARATQALIEVGQGMADAYREDGGGLYGVLAAINTVNPALSAMKAGYRAYEAWENGDYETSGREAFRSAQATVATVAIATAGARFFTSGARKLSGGDPCNCFAAGTPVVTASGLVAIELLRPGDLVLSRDVATGETAYRPITAIVVTPNDPLIALTDTSGALAILATPWHPFWVESRGWTRADQLEPGLLVTDARGLGFALSAEQSRGATGTTYNLEVSDFHTYFVGNAGIWVHNCAGGRPGAYTPSRELPVDKHGVPVPDVDVPHTQLGRSRAKFGSEPQAREWDVGSNGKLQPRRDVDFTDHGHPDAHPNPHQHELIPNNTALAPQGGYRRGDPKPL
ncbi:MAG TPA: SpvB/TcaC N-terminal domain-containing protein [Polyangiaceae bacterium]|nr:SpvB/TcaC N-terminal domain-containing protein [Polyangiaceae bacterium]